MKKRGLLEEKSKKAISEVVATVLIILITIASVSIVWLAIVPMVKKNLEEGSVCFDASGQLSIGDEFTCIKSDGKIQIQIARNLGKFELIGIQVSALMNTGDTNQEEIRDNLPNVNEESVFTLSKNDYTGAEEVEIAPIIKSGAKEKLCENVDSAELDACS